MKSTGQQQVLLLEADAAAYGFRKIQDGDGKSRWFNTCCNCGRDSVGLFNATLQNADQLVRHLSKQGWQFKRKEWQYCSTQCAREAKAKQQAKRKENGMTSAPAPPAPTPEPAPVPTATTGNPAIVRRVITLLNDHFDTTKRMYESGWDDERVAKTGPKEEWTSKEFVAKCRITYGYGELAEDPEFNKLREDIKAADELFASQLKALEKSFEHQIGELKGRVEKLAARAHHKASG